VVPLGCVVYREALTLKWFGWHMLLLLVATDPFLQLCGILLLAGIEAEYL
jgi:hypothetical protein